MALIEGPERIEASVVSVLRVELSAASSNEPRALENLRNNYIIHARENIYSVAANTYVFDQMNLQRSEVYRSVMKINVLGKERCAK